MRLAVLFAVILYPLLRQFGCQMFSYGCHVLVATAAQIDHNDMILGQRRRQLGDIGDGVRRLQRRDDALVLAQRLEPLQRLLIGDRHILNPLDVMQPGVFGTDARIIQTGRDRVGILNLAVFGLQQEGTVAVQYTRLTAFEAGRMALVQTLTARFHTDHFDRCIIEERVEQPHCVGAAADTGDQGIRQAPLLLHDLTTGFFTDDSLEVTYHGRIRVRTGYRTDDVESAVDIGHPVTQCFVHRILQRAGTTGYRDHLGTEQLHALHVGLLTMNVGAAHVDYALHTEACRRSEERRVGKGCRKRWSDE